MQIYSTWLSLPIGVRHQLAHKLGIEKKFPTEVQDNQIKSDGYALKDIEIALAIENLQKVLETEEKDHKTLLDWMIGGKPELNPSSEINPLPRSTYINLPTKKIVPGKKRGRKPKVK